MFPGVLFCFVGRGGRRPVHREEDAWALETAGLSQGQVRLEFDVRGLLKGIRNIRELLTGHWRERFCDLRKWYGRPGGETGRSPNNHRSNGNE